MAQNRPAVKAVQGSLDWVHERAWRQIGDGWVREVFPDRLIVERENGVLEERSWTADGGELVLGDPRTVTLEYVAKAEGGPRLAGPFVAKDEARRLVYGAVLVPGEPDSDGEVLSAEKIEEVAHTYLESFRAIDNQHDVVKIDASPVESYIEPVDREVEIDGETVTLPAGTWTMAVKVHDDATWKQVVDGERAGFSIMGVPESSLDVALEAVKREGVAALKRTTLADVGGGDPNGPWLAPFVSLVDAPAVPKAKFFAIKAHAAGEAPGGWWRRLFGAGKAGRRISDARLEKLQQVHALLGEVLAEGQDERAGKAREVQDMTPDEVSAAVKSAVGEALKPIEERLTKLEGGEGAGKSDAGDAGADAGKSAGEEGGVTLEAIGELIDQKLKPVAELAERAEKRTRPGSAQVDVAGEVEPALKGTIGRDAFGRRIA